VRDPDAASRFIGELLGLEPASDGPDGELRSLRLDRGALLLFAPAASVSPHHLALRVSPGEFEEILQRLRARQVAFGNDPEDRTNRCSEDPLGGWGRVYFVDADGHLFEVCA
jgi:catechol 2,3-dioxygenase-like lactoylglutathione lyase family enzyme